MLLATLTLCIQLDYLQAHDRSMPSFQYLAYGANVKFKTLFPKNIQCSILFHTSRPTEQYTSASSHANLFLPCGTETTAKDFLFTSLQTAKVSGQPEFIWFPCCINLWNQRALYSCSLSLTINIASADKQQPHKSTSTLDIWSLSQMLERCLQPKSISLLVRWFLILGGVGCID